MLMLFVKKLMSPRLLLCCAMLWLSGITYAQAPDDFNEAKRKAVAIFAGQTDEFYCGCAIRWQGGKGIPDLTQCGYQVRKNGPRATRIEWEHVVPAQQFGHQAACWQQGGRELCSKKDRAFRQMEADLYNLRPAIGEVNGDRAHFRFSELPGEPSQYGYCPFQLDIRQQLAEPRPQVRGDIARIYFYMADKYQLALSAREEQLFLRWHQQDPVDPAELALNRRIAQTMGWPNPFVTGDKIWFAGYQVNQSRATHVERESDAPSSVPQTVSGQATGAVMGNKNSRKYHLPHCLGFNQIKQQNQQVFESEQAALAAGFSRAGNCR